MVDAAKKMHSDVLESNPEDPDAKERLVEELKSRGNLAFKHSRLEEAELLYSHAITVLPTHVMYSNRAMVRLKQKDRAGAIADADECIKLDPTFAKGYYRKGAALEGLKKYGPAYDAYKEALARTKKGKEYDKLKKTTDEMYRKACKAMAEGDGPAPAPAPKKKSSSEAAAGASNKTKATAASETVVVQDGDVESELRGYKTLSDGRKTSYFHRELDEEAKRLLSAGSGPKKLDAAAAAEIERQNSKSSGGSAWNTAKTFEDKDMTSWAKSNMESILGGVSQPLPTAAGGGTFEVKKVKDVDGDASTPIIRGNKRYILDLQVKVEWLATLSNGTKVKGVAECPDISSDCDPSEFEVNVRITTKSSLPSDDTQAAIRTHAVSCIRDALVDFTAQFNAL